MPFLSVAREFETRTLPCPDNQETHSRGGEKLAAIVYGRRIAGLVACAVSMLAALGVFMQRDLVSADDKAASGLQTREFSIIVDGKERGKSQMSISRRPDGTEVMSGRAEVRIKYLVYTYQYSSRATETWKDGRLQQLENSANYGGKEYVVNAVATEDGLNVKVNGQERTARPDVWVTSYWKLPDPKYRNQSLPLLNGDTGRDIRGALERVGTEKITVAGKPQQAERYRVKGDVQVDLWYDQQERLVRQESLESGHRTVLELARIRP